jgi:hypothetical protein
MACHGIDFIFIGILLLNIRCETGKEEEEAKGRVWGGNNVVMRELRGVASIQPLLQSPSMNWGNYGGTAANWPQTLPSGTEASEGPSGWPPKTPFRALLEWEEKIIERGQACGHKRES